jgi:murein DD-endopeptidase MepM/ murein hydrolase activator NlpD
LISTMPKRYVSLLLTIGMLWWTTPAVAQDTGPTATPTPEGVSGPVYIVQPGDTLYNIALDFGVSLSDLLSANNITDANTISAGAQITIPGLQGISGVLTMQPIVFGDTLDSISRRDQVPEDMLRRLNHITSPEELYAGRSLIYPKKDSFTPLSTRIDLKPGQTLLEASVLAQSDPWSLTSLNELKGSWAAAPGEALFSAAPAPATTPAASGLPAAIVSATFSPLPIIQGGTAEITVQTLPGVTLSGTLVDRSLHFFAPEKDKYVALQGAYALLEPGPYPLEIDATLPDGSTQRFEQMVIVKDGEYPTDPVLTVGSDTLDPVENDAEIKQLQQLTAPVTPTKYWQGGFKNPTLPQFADCHPSFFGDRRNYIGSGTAQTYHSFHAGLDFCEQVGDPLYATADGVVIFTGLLTAHGNTTIIDHGWGIYSMYSHQSEMDVQVGQTVKAGDQIGLAGKTGRVTGPHLHLEVWVNGVEVNPVDWLTNIYP